MWFQIEKPVGTHPSEKSENKDKTNRRTSKTQQSGSGWFGGIWDKLARRPNNQMKLPDDKNPSIVWDEKSKRWVNTDASEEEQSAQLKPPPKASELNGSAIPSAPTQAPTSTPASGPGMATSGLPPPSTTSTNIYKLQRGKDNQGGGFSWEIEWINQNDLLVVGSVMPDACLLQVAETASQSRDDVICVMGGTTVTIWEPTSNLLIFGRRISSLKQENACTVNNIPNEV
ncbi:hypothetical protein J6590_023853 [Homalodisca vitripennis]|nr:hypothetical protein J6590_023853 [Homalodisca vitripennis]